jgi:predicted phosphodiesterase
MRIPRREAVRLLLGGCTLGAAGCADADRRGNGSPPPVATPPPAPPPATTPPAVGTPTQDWVIRSNPLATHQDLKRGPYVQLGSVDSILVAWQTVANTVGVIEYGATPELGIRLSTGVWTTRHSIAIAGLEPNTQYYYKVFSGDVPLSGVLQFRTSNDSDNRSFKFLVIGDSGVGSREQMRIAGYINNSQAAFGLHTGDVIYPNGEEENYDPHFFYPYSLFLSRSVMYPTFGNHDQITEGGEPYFRNFHLPRNDQTGSETFYSFDYGHAHFVCLNTQDYSGVSSHQRRWLIRDLERNTKPWKFVYFHMPPYTAGYLEQGGSKIPLDTPAVRENLVPLFEQYGVDVVFSGHCHSYERTFPLVGGQVAGGEAEPWYSNPRGPIYVVTGGGGARLLGLDSSPLNAREILAHHFVEMELRDNELIGRTIGMNGQLLDEFHIVRDGAGA